MNESKIKILIADDHAVVREGLIHIISKFPDLIVVHEVKNGLEILKAINEIKIDLLIMDIEMPGKKGIDIVKEVKTLKPDLNILVLSVFPEENYAIRYLKAGASGYINKTSAPQELVKAIRKVSKRDGKYISPSLAEQMVLNWEKKQSEFPHDVLTDREFQIFCQLAKGNSLKQIAKDLSISVTTVSTHRANILQKMNFKNNADLTLYAHKNQLINE